MEEGVVFRPSEGVSFFKRTFKEQGTPKHWGNVIWHQHIKPKVSFIMWRAILDIPRIYGRGFVHGFTFHHLSYHYKKSYGGSKDMGEELDTATLLCV
ncbi:hypothetical protein Dimus_030204 [Dionaea muscipula]